jgi:hypothetical protein
MKTSAKFVTTVFAIASLPLLAQQPPPSGQTPPASPAASQEGPVVEMSPVKCELVSKLDSKTAKAGDSVVVETKASAKTADGTEIPKGSKLVGRVMAAQASGASENTQNSQVVLQFDHLELKGGQSLPVHSQIQSIAPAGGTASNSSSYPTSAPPMASTPNGSTPSASGAGSSRPNMPQGTGNGSGPGAGSASGAPPAGTLVAKTGNIAIRATSIPGVLVANNEPGQQDPRMANASSILLGAKQDIELDGGTEMVVGVSAKGGGTQ